MNKFLFDFRVIIEWLLPVENRQPLFIAWIYDMLAYIRSLHADFITWGSEKIDDVSWSNDTISLENHLILLFGEGIQVINNLRLALPTFLYDTHDSRNQLSYDSSSPSNKFIYESGVYDDTVKSFTVFVPDDLVFDEVKMRAIINKYLFVSANYNIETYTP